MNKKLKIPKGDMGWCFAFINGKLGEIYFTIGKGVKGIYAHCYIKRKEFDNNEQKMIDNDTKKHKIIYKNKKYSLQVIK